MVESENDPDVAANCLNILTKCKLSPVSGSETRSE